MKKLTFSVFACIVACTTFAKGFSYDEENIDHPVTPFSFSLATPLQLPTSSWNVYGLALNVFYAQHHVMYGLDAGLTGFNRDDAAGVLLQGVANWSNSDVYGLQIAGLANAVMGNTAGLQLASVANYNRGEFYGGQVSLINHNGMINGFQAGVFNYNKGVCKALQIGAANADVNEYRGCSIGAVNYAGRFRGLQIGLINEIVETGRGVQIGVFNGAVNYSGLQIGLFNVISKGSLPIMVVMNAQF